MENKKDKMSAQDRKPSKASSRSPEMSPPNDNQDTKMERHPISKTEVHNTTTQRKKLPKSAT
jgi:hypothetical protein